MPFIAHCCHYSYILIRLPLLPHYASSASVYSTSQVRGSPTLLLPCRGRYPGEKPPPPLPPGRITGLCVIVFHFHRFLTISTSTINQQLHLYNFHLKHLKPLRHVSIFSDHYQGLSSFLAKVITYSRFSSFL